MNDSDRRAPGAALGKILERLQKVRRAPGGHKACCPAHPDSNPSLSITENAAGAVLLHCFSGCSVEAIVTALGLEFTDLYPEKPPPERSPTHGLRFCPPSSQETPMHSSSRPDNGQQSTHDPFAMPSSSPPPRSLPEPDPELPADENLLGAIGREARGRPWRHWTYLNGEGRVQMAVVRFEPKDFRPFHLSQQGRWVMGDPPGPLPLYNLLGAADYPRIYVTEGEKAADTACLIGLAAVTSAHGSSSARKTDWSPLAGKEVIILPDQDEAGQKYAEEVRQILCELKPAPDVLILELPGLGPGEDIVDLAERRDGASPEPQERVFEALRQEIEDLVEGAWTSLGIPRMSFPEFLSQPRHIEAPLLSRDGREGLEVPMLTTDQLVMLCADGGLGKTWLAMQLTASIATGQPWIGVRSHPARAWLIAQEIPHNRGQERLEAIQQALGDAVGPAAEVTTYSALQDRDLVLDVRQAEVQQAIRRGILQGNHDLVIIDPLVHSIGDADENDNAEAGLVMHALKRIRAEVLARRGRPVTIILVHHERKPAAGEIRQERTAADVRGSGRWVTDCSLILQLSQTKIRESKGALIKVLRATKDNGCWGDDIYLVPDERGVLHPIATEEVETLEAAQQAAQREEEKAAKAVTWAERKQKCIQDGMDHKQRRQDQLFEIEVSEPPEIAKDDAGLKEVSGSHRAAIVRRNLILFPAVWAWSAPWAASDLAQLVVQADEGGEEPGSPWMARASIRRAIDHMSQAGVLDLVAEEPRSYELSSRCRRALMALYNAGDLDYEGLASQVEIPPKEAAELLRGFLALGWATFHLVGGMKRFSLRDPVREAVLKWNANDDDYDEIWVG